MFFGRVLLLFSCFFWVCSITPSDASEAPSFDKGHVSLHPSSGKDRTLRVQIAQTSQQQAYGLMFRKEMAKDTGMLFLYAKPQLAKYWMKNTLIPLDMIFIDVDNRVISIISRAKPHDETPQGPDVPVKAVLELLGGQAAQFGLKKGDKVKYRLF